MGEGLLELLFLALFVIVPIILEVAKKKKRSMPVEEDEQEQEDKGILTTILEKLEAVQEEFEAKAPPAQEIKTKTPLPVEKITKVKPQITKTPIQRPRPADIESLKYLDELRAGIIWSEILAPPVSRRPKRYLRRGYYNAGQKL